MKILPKIILIAIFALVGANASAADLSVFDGSGYEVFKEHSVAALWQTAERSAERQEAPGEAGIDVGQEAMLQDDAGASFSMSNLWALTEKAGPLRWPIFVVFVIGVFLVCFKLFELMADQRESRNIETLEFRSMGLQQIIRMISSQRESMLSRLHAIMLNVFNSQQANADLHDEIANFVQFQQDRFDTFRRRVDFLSDTAGALGLLGTVWGLFTVFSQGLLDDQVILTGMGFALITTLLGIIVSIILNLSSTEVSSYFNRRLDRIAEKSDELRFRLMELVTNTEDTMLDMLPSDMGLPSLTAPAPQHNMSPSPVMPPMNTDYAPEPIVSGGREMDGAPAMTEASREDKESVTAKRAAEKEPVQKASVKKAVPGQGAATQNSTSQHPSLANNLVNPALQQEAKPIAQVEAVFQDRFSNSNYGDSAPSTIRKPLIDSVEVPPQQEPHELVIVNPVREDTVGKQLKNLCFRLLDEEGDPIASRQVEISVSEGEGLLNDAQKQILLETDNNGEVRCDWQLAKKSGKQAITARVPGAESPSTRYTHGILTKPGVPRKLKQFGNNQGGAAGEPLNKPLKVQVLDEFENPISEWPVMFSIEMGGGAFENGKGEIKVKTNENGEGVVHLKVGTEPGFNTVKAAVEGVMKELKFQAMSMA